MPFDTACGWLDHLAEWPPDYYINTALLGRLCMMVAGFSGGPSKLQDFAPWLKPQEQAIPELSPEERYAHAVANAARERGR